MRKKIILYQMESYSVLLFSVILATISLLITAEAKERFIQQVNLSCNLPDTAIFVNPSNGTLNSSCWSEGQDRRCGSLPYAIQGAKQTNLPVVVLPGLYQTNGFCVCDHIKCNTWFYEEENCNTWFRRVCGGSFKYLVKCYPKTMTIELLSCYCMTYDNKTKKTVVGVCDFWCYNSYDDPYKPIPADPLNVNEAICGRFNRTGQLCGECKDGYYQPVYSYDTACVQCTYHPYNWLLYALAAFGPLTVFYIIILVFRINVISPPLAAYVQLCQMITVPFLLRSYNTSLHTQPELSRMKWAMNLVITICSIWNLDFFRVLYPPICLHLKGLPVLAIDYAIACYPILLVILTYALIELHDRNVRVIVWFMKPFYVGSRLFGLGKRDMKSSVISAFASFIFLSNIKFLSVSSDLLLPIRVYTMNGTIDWYLFHLPTVKYFSTAHLPYALTAIAILLIFIVIPLLLVLLYPFRWFKWILGYCRLHSHALQTFMDTFQGYLKDGTNSTQDCRYFAAAYLILRIILFVLYGFTKSITWPLMSVLTIALATIFIVLKPYKFQHHNTVDVSLCLTLALLSIAFLCMNTSYYLYPQALVFTYVLVALILTLPLVIAIIYWTIINKYPHRLITAGRSACRNWHKKVSVEFSGNEPPNQENEQNCYLLIEMQVKPEN